MTATVEAMTNEVVEIKVALATIESKLDSVVERLDKINGSVARLQQIANDHENALVVLNTEKNMLAKIAKPALFVLCIVVAGLLGHQVDVKEIVEMFR